jgi:hypothetical protein
MGDLPVGRGAGRLVRIRRSGCRGPGRSALLVVGPHVARLTELQSALLAGVGLQPRVIVHMSLEMMLLGEGL